MCYLPNTFLIGNRYLSVNFVQSQPKPNPLLKKHPMSPVAYTTPFFSISPLQHESYLQNVHSYSRSILSWKNCSDASWLSLQWQTEHIWHPHHRWYSSYREAKKISIQRIQGLFRGLLWGFQGALRVVVQWEWRTLGPKIIVPRVFPSLHLMGSF